MKKLFFVLPIMSSIITQSCQKKLYPEDAYLDDYFFISSVGGVFKNKKGKVLASFLPSDNGDVDFMLAIGSFIVETGWNAKSYLNLYGQNSYNTFFQEIDEICSVEYQTYYMDDWLEVKKGTYTYYSHIVTLFQGELPFSLFENKYDSALFTIQFFKNSELVMTLSSSGIITYDGEIVTGFHFSRITKDER